MIENQSNSNGGLSSKEIQLEQLVFHLEESRKILAELLLWDEVDTPEVYDIATFMVGLNALFRCCLTIGRNLKGLAKPT